MFRSKAFQDALDKPALPGVAKKDGCPLCGGRVVYQGFHDIECDSAACVNAAKNTNDLTEGDYLWAAELLLVRGHALFECVWPEALVRKKGLVGYVVPGVWRAGYVSEWYDAPPADRPNKWRLKPKT
jgi:hypothetical protein